MDNIKTVNAAITVKNLKISRKKEINLLLQFKEDQGLGHFNFK